MFFSFLYIFWNEKFLHSGTFPLSSARVSTGGGEARTVQSRKLMIVLGNGHWLFGRGWAGGSGRSWVSLERSRPAGGLFQQRRAQQQQDKQHFGGEFRRQRDLARVGSCAPSQLWLAPGLLTQYARVGCRTAAADVVDTHPTILAAQEFVVTHPGWEEAQARQQELESNSL